ncbi:hypothetical protein AVEN_212276-1, partial [Araneus ventricosus]
FPTCQHHDFLEICLVILASRFEVTRGLFWNSPRNFEPGGQMTRTTPELEPLAKPTGGRLATTHDLTRNRPIHGGSSVESGFEPKTFQPQSRDTTTGRLRPHGDEKPPYK